MIATSPRTKEPAASGAEGSRRHAALVDRVEKTRQECRRFLLVRGEVLTILTLLIVGGLLALADYFWILGQSIRQANWIVAGAIVAAIALWRIVRSRRAAIDRLDTAAEIETAFPDLGQRVCTTLEYADPTPSTMPAWPSLVRALTTDTEERTIRLDFMQVVPWRRLRWPALSATVLAVVFVLAIAIWPSARVAAMRLFLIPVHYTELNVEPGNQSVNFEGDVKIRAILSGRPVTKAELLSRKAGSEEPWTAVSLGPDDAQDAPLNGTLETSIKRCREDTEYRVTADAVESETYLLTILHPLILKKTEATIEPPAYTRKEATTVKQGEFQVIEGSAVRFRFELDRPAQTAWLRLVPTGKAAASGKTLPPAPLSIQGKMLTGTLKNVTQDLEYEIHAEAADGMKLQPRQFHISVQPDCKPVLTFVKPAAVIEALPTTEVTVQVSAKDDFGLTKVGIVYQIGDGPKETLRLDEDPRQPVSLTSLATLYLEEHKLNYQDGIVYYAFAEDNYPSGPHRVTSELQFIDIRPYKRTFVAGKMEGKPGKSVTLELLIGRQRTNLQHTFSQCGESKVDARIAKRLTKAERSLAKLTAEFAAALEAQVGQVPSLEQAIESMQAAVSELEKKNMKPSCGKEEIALAQLIQARENLRLLLANPKTGGETEKLDYQAQKNMPETPKDKDEDEEEPAEDLQKQIADLAKTERDTADELDGKSVAGSSNPQSPKDNRNKSASQGPPTKSDSSQGGQSPKSESGNLAERQQRAAQQAAELVKKMEADEAMTDLAQERMANAERTIRSSAQSLERGNKSDAGQKAREAAAQLERLGRQVAGLKAAELAAKLQAAETIARQVAQQQRDTEKGEEENESPGEGQSESQSQSQGEGQSQSQSKSQSKGQGDGQGEGGDGGDAAGSTRSADRQRAKAEEVRTAEDILNEAQKDASLTDPQLVRALDEAATANSPKEIAAQMHRAAKALSAGEREQARREIRQSAKRLDAFADQIEAARHSFAQPKLDALLAAEKQAAEIQKKLTAPVADEERSDIEKKMSDLRGALGPLRGTDPNLRKATNALTDAIEGGLSGRGAWRQSRQGYYELPELYTSAIQRVDRALQVRIQELILKDAILDEDQPVPEQYRKHVEEYYRALSEDFR